MVTQKYKNISLAVLLILIGTLNSFACSCGETGTVKNSVKYSDAVFSGQVLSRVLTNNYDSMGIVVDGDTSDMSPRWRRIPVALTVIKLDSLYKGQWVSDTITVLTAHDGAACGFYFEVGKKYIVYGTLYDELLAMRGLKRQTLDNKTFSTNLCTRTREWSKEEEKAILKVTK